MFARVLNLVNKTRRGVLADLEHVQDDWMSSIGGFVGIRLIAMRLRRVPHDIA